MTQQGHDLERELRVLRGEFRNYEKKLKVLQGKPDSTVIGTKRRRSEDAKIEPTTKRLRSSVASDAKDRSTHPQENSKTEEKVEKSAEKREVAPQSSEEKKRNKRLLGSLLLGTLASFKKQVDNEAQILQQRKEVERITEEKVSSEHQKFLEEQQKKRHEDISTYQARLEKVLQEIQTKEAELLKLKSEAHAKLLANFLVTKNSSHAIYYLPGKRDEFTERVLGTTPVVLEVKPDTNKTTTDSTSNSAAASSTSEKSKKSTDDTDRKEHDHVPVEEAPKKEDERQDNLNEEEDKDEKEKQEEKKRTGEEVSATSSSRNSGVTGNEEELAEGVTPHS